MYNRPRLRDKDKALKKKVTTSRCKCVSVYMKVQCNYVTMTTIYPQSFSPFSLIQS